MLDSLRRDVRWTIRTLAARPGWTIAAILCLGIATGANTAAFTIVNGLLLRPLPFDAPEQLVMVALRDPALGSPRPFALAEYRRLAASQDAAATLLARTFFPLSLASDDGARMAQAELVSGNYFETLRVTPFLGRFFDTDADRAGSPAAVVLSHRLWRLRFGADTAIVGRTVRVNGRPAIVAGVGPPGFVGAMQLIAADLWLPAAMYPELAGSAEAASVPMFGVMGRLAEGVTVDQAQARLANASRIAADGRIAQGSSPVIVKRAAGFGVPAAAEGAVLALSWFIYLLMALLMAVACANVAALVLARGAGRTREIAVRISLGASRPQIARQLLTESALLTIAGCGVGTAVALWLTQALVARLTTPFQYVSYAIDVHPDVRVFAYSALATAAAAAVCGVVPIRLAGRADVIDVIRQSAAKGRAREAVRTLNAMVVAQFAVSTMLLVAAGTLVRAYVRAQSVRPAFDAASLIAATLDLDQLRLDRAAGARLYDALVERLATVPRVTAVALTRDLPVRPGRAVSVTADDRASGATARGVPAEALIVSPGYFDTVGLALRHGRVFEPREPARPSVAVINEAMARRLWPDGSAVGRTFTGDAPNAGSIEVIGVVSNPVGGAPDRGPQPAFYRPFPHEYAARMSVVLRVQGDPRAVLGDVRLAVHDVDGNLSIVDLRTLDDLIDDLAGQRRIPATALSLVALLGLLLSAVGLYGVVAYGVRERSRELSIRLALGARPSDVRRLVLRQGFGIVAIGLVAGVAATAAFTQLVRSALFGAGALDPLTLAAVCGILTIVALSALYVPARAASGLEPAQTLRAE